MNTNKQKFSIKKILSCSDLLKWCQDQCTMKEDFIQGIRFCKELIEKHFFLKLTAFDLAQEITEFSGEYEQIYTNTKEDAELLLLEIKDKHERELEAEKEKENISPSIIIVPDTPKTKKRKRESILTKRKIRRTRWRGINVPKNVKSSKVEGLNADMVIRAFQLVNEKQKVKKPAKMKKLHLFAWRPLLNRRGFEHLVYLQDENRVRWMKTSERQHYSKEMMNFRNTHPPLSALTTNERHILNQQAQAFGIPNIFPMGVSDSESDGEEEALLNYKYGTPPNKKMNNVDFSKKRLNMSTLEVEDDDEESCDSTQAYHNQGDFSFDLFDNDNNNDNN